jgi:hypothetical protein
MRPLGMGFIVRFRVRRPSAFTRLREARYGRRRKVCGKTFLLRWAWGSSLKFTARAHRRSSAFICG